MSNVGIGYLLILVLGTYFFAVSTQTELGEENAEGYKLPNHTIPTHYNITLRTEVARNNFAFTGKSIINLTVLRDTDTLMFHACNLILDESQTSLHDKYQRTMIPLIKHSYDRGKEIMILHSKFILKAGNYVLSLSFKGVLNSKGIGFFRSYYLSDQKDARWLASTFFEPTYARHAFPCWDEPALKATFDVSIQHDRNYSAISNMPILLQKDAGDMMETKFRTSPIMPTYLVAFVVSDFEYVTNKYENFTVWTSKDRIQEAVYARDVGQVILRELEEFTGIPFVLPKMDQVAIPGMPNYVDGEENWGLVVYRPTYLLCNHESSESDRILRMSVIAHELAHQWFGNLVTPALWEYTWLKEGFGTYFQYYILDQINTSWKTMEKFFIQIQLQYVFGQDDTSLNQYTRSPEKYWRNTIIYYKAACIIRMMSHMLTEEVFREGLRIYLRSRSFTYTTPGHLFNSLQEAVNKSGIFPETFSVEVVMDPWVQQASYPVIDIIRNYKNRSLIIKQKIFINQQDSHDYKWYIPITYATQEDLNFNNTFPRMFMEPNNRSTDLSIDLSPALWIIFNVQGTGYYRVNYDVENWFLIAQYLKTEKFANIHKLNRAQLISDAWYMVLARKQNHSVALEISDYLRQEDEFELWAVAFPHFKRVNEILVNTKYKHLFQTYVTRMMDKLTDAIKYKDQPNEIDSHSVTRSHIIDWDCAVGARGCRSFAQKELKQWLSIPPSQNMIIQSDLMDAILCGGLREANQDTWNAVFKRYSNATRQERNMIGKALVCSLSDNILTGYFRILLEPESGITLDSAVFAMRQNNPGMTDIILNFMLNNISKIKSRLSSNDFEELLYQVSRTVFTVEQQDQFIRFASHFNLSESDKLWYSKDIERHMKNSLRIAESIGQWLEDHHAANVMNRFSEVIDNVLNIRRFFCRALQKSACFNLLTKNFC